MFSKFSANIEDTKIDLLNYTSHTSKLSHLFPSHSLNTCTQPVSIWLIICISHKGLESSKLCPLSLLLPTSQLTLSYFFNILLCLAGNKRFRALELCTFITDAKQLRSQNHRSMERLKLRGTLSPIQFQTLDQSG